jgi:hypothetical protein
LSRIVESIDSVDRTRATPEGEELFNVFRYSSTAVELLAAPFARMHIARITTKVAHLKLAVILFLWKMYLTEHKELAPKMGGFRILYDRIDRCTVSLAGSFD